MIRKLEKPKRGRKPKYPWELYTNGAIHTKRCSDVPPESFVVACRYQARQRGLEVVANITGKIVRFQFAKAKP